MTSPVGNPEVHIELDNFKPGSVIAFRFKPNEIQNEACVGLKKLLSNDSDLRKIIDELTLSDLNHVLFKCEQEEQDGNPEGGVFIYLFLFFFSLFFFFCFIF